jgi:signal transduction histidine kinase
MNDCSADSAEAVAAVGRIDAVPTLLEVLCDITGMRFAVVARVTETTWTACAVKDDILFGLQPGGQLPVNDTLCFESRAERAAIVIEQASADPRYCTHRVPKLYQIESYVSVPIILRDGRYFGNLCTIDPHPAKVAEPRIVSMFTRFAALIATQLDNQLLQDREHSALIDERATGELREQFIAILGHDLRNPLQAVCAGGDLLERRLSDPVLLGIARRIKASAGRMSSLIDDVLDFARGRLGGGIGLSLADLANVNEGLMTVVQELEDAQPDCNIISRFDVNCAVRCDLGRMQQVASNLLSNALTHGLPGSPVTITVLAEEDDWVIEVWNAGDPIPAEYLDQIFQPFWRHSVSPDRKGLGLGLHICAQIVRAHQGRISVASSWEKGTQFTARLPLGMPRTRAFVLDARGDDNRDKMNGHSAPRHAPSDGNLHV